MVAGGGMGLLIMVLLVWLLGGNPLQFLAQVQQPQPGGVPGAYRPELVIACASFYRAMSLNRLGQKPHAHECFEIGMRGMRGMKPYPIDESQPLAGGGDQNELIVWLACKEAAALLGLPHPARQ